MMNKTSEGVREINVSRERKRFSDALYRKD